MNTIEAYHILELEPGASEREIKASYRRLVKEVHPDLSRDISTQEQFVRISEAYQLLLGRKSAEVYSPWQEQEEERQREAQKKAAQWERWRRREEEAQKQRLRMLQKVNRILSRFVACYLLFAAVLALDFFLPLTTHSEEVVGVQWVYESVGIRGSNNRVYRYDDVYFRDFRLRTSSQLSGTDIRYGKATVYTSFILGKVRKAEVQEIGDGMVLLEPAYDFYTVFGLLIPLVLVLGLAYFLLPETSEGRLTIGVMLFFAGMMHLGLAFLS